MSEPAINKWVDSVWIDLLNSVIAIDIRDEDAIKAVLARHAPKPEDQPIRRGDVVQWTGNCHPKMVGVYYIVKHVTVEKGENFYGGDYGENSLFSTAEGLIRIGRAKFYPDGSKGED